MAHIPQGYAAVLHSLKWTNDADPMAVTYGIEVDPATLDSQISTMAANLGTLFSTHMLPRLPATIEQVQTEVTWQIAALPDDPIVASSVTGAGAGSNGESALLPANSAFLVHKRTARGGRKGRGRMYFPGVAESQSDNLGNLIGTALTSWNTSLAAWLAAIASNSLIVGMVLLHTNDLATDGAPNLVTSLNLDSVIATQRRRLRK